MDGEQLLIDGGIVVGFLALITFWIGMALWMWADAEKHGRTGWFWSYVGLLGGPVGLVGYLFYRSHQPTPVEPPSSQVAQPVTSTEAIIQPAHHLPGQTKLD